MPHESYKVIFLCNSHTFKRASLLTHNSSLPLLSPRGPYTLATACLSHLHATSPALCVHRRCTDLPFENFSHHSCVSPTPPASAVSSSPAPSLPSVCTSHTSSSHNPFHPGVLLDPHLTTGTPRPSPNSI